MNSKDLLSCAQKYLSHSHSPYSQFRVASAIELENGEVFGGCNIENASYGGTVCAERVAIWKALSEYPGQKIRRVLVLTETAAPWWPCGFCRQVIAEFATPQTQIEIASPAGVQSRKSFAEIFPDSFSPEDLKVPSS